jgi:hypothetical protein
LKKNLVNFLKISLKIFTNDPACVSLSEPSEWPGTANHVNSAIKNLSFILFGLFEEKWIYFTYETKKLFHSLGLSIDDILLELGTTVK